MNTNFHLNKMFNLAETEINTVPNIRKAEFLDDPPPEIDSIIHVISYSLDTDEIFVEW